MTYEKGTGNEDNNTVTLGGLGIKSTDLVLDLAEGQALFINWVSYVSFGSAGGGIPLQGSLTTSFSTIPAAPRTELVSKVSIELSRC